MGIAHNPKKCPECGADLRPPAKPGRALRIFISISIGTLIGLASGFWFVDWWFEGSGFFNTMAIVHEISGAILGGLTGWGAGAYASRS